MPMRFLVDYVPELIGDEEFPPYSLLVGDDIIRELVKNRCLQANEVSNPHKVARAIDVFLRVALGDTVSQKVSGTRN